MFDMLSASCEQESRRTDSLHILRFIYMRRVAHPLTGAMSPPVPIGANDGIVP